MALWIDPVACCTSAPQRDHSRPHSRRASRARGSCAPRPHPRAPPLAGSARGPAPSHVPSVGPATACSSSATIWLLKRKKKKAAVDEGRQNPAWGRPGAEYAEERKWPFQLRSPIREPADVPLSKKLAAFGKVLLQAWGPSKDSSKAAGSARG